MGRGWKKKANRADQSIGSAEQPGEQPQASGSQGVQGVTKAAAGAHKVAVLRPAADSSSLRSAFAAGISWNPSTPPAARLEFASALAQAIAPLREALKTRPGFDVQDTFAETVMRQAEEDAMGRLEQRIAAVERKASNTHGQLEHIAKLVSLYRPTADRLRQIAELEMEFAEKKLAILKVEDETTPDSGGSDSEGPGVRVSGRTETARTATARTSDGGGQGAAMGGTARRRTSSPLHVPVQWGLPPLSKDGVVPKWLFNKYLGSFIERRTDHPNPYPEHRVKLPAPFELLEHRPSGVHLSRSSSAEPPGLERDTPSCQRG